jgi:hypothetical protein
MTLLKQYFNVGFGCPFRFRVNKERGQAVSASDCFTIYHWFQYRAQPRHQPTVTFNRSDEGKNKDKKRNFQRLLVDI